MRNLWIGDAQVEQLDAVSAWSDKYVYQEHYSQTWRSDFKLNQQKRKLKRKWNDANLKGLRAKVSREDPEKGTGATTGEFRRRRENLLF